MNDPQSLRRRAERILPVPDSGGGAQPSTAQYAPYAPRVIAVLDRIDGDVLYWQRIRYANRRVPKVGEYKRFGPIEKGYPLETAEASDYESAKWGSAAVDKTTTPVWATFRHGVWIIELMGGGGGIIPVALVRVGGAQGSTTSPASWFYDIHDLITNQLLDGPIQPTVPPHRWTRPSAGWMTQATFGYAHRDPEGHLILGWINETVVQEACAS